MKFHVVFILILLALSVLAGSELPGTAALAELNSPEDCLAALKQDDQILRRSAFCKLLSFPGRKDAAVMQGLKDKDPQIRKRALFEYFTANQARALPEMLKMANDQDPQVQSLLIECASRFSTLPETKNLIAELGKNTRDEEIKRKANRLISLFNFYREKPRLSENPSFDYNISTIKSIPLPENDWRFVTDPTERGHVKDFFLDKYDDSKWVKVKSGSWEDQGFRDYDGIAWYRIRFSMPRKIDCNAVELLFRGVDEEAWIWLNGVYIGQHAIGPSGWELSFQLDVSSEIRWNSENILTVRVNDSSGAGGIYAPVSIELLK